MAGEIVHIEFPSEDVDRAQRFWGGLFGWEFGDAGTPEFDYRMARTGESSGVAVFKGEIRKPGHPSYYFDTPDIDASRAKVAELGGEAEAKQPVEGHGWFAKCKDSEGNEFHLWQSNAPAA
jgi:predicted enzyme related to lactoylglutathione lyase